MEGIWYCLIQLQDYINEICKDTPSWQIILRTAGVTLVLVWLKGFLFQDESLFTRAKKTVFKLARKIPAIRNKIESEVAKVSVSMNETMNKSIDYAPYITKLPADGWKYDQVIDEAAKYTRYGHYNWKEGCASGTVYNYNKSLTDLTTEVYGLAAWSNPLHADVFPGVRKMEAEVVRMCCTMFHGDAKSCGCITSGGTESIVLACKAYRDYAINVKGIRKPEILVPVTGHAAFDKAAQLLGIAIKHVPIDPVTMKADISVMKRMITSRTCMLAGSAPQFPHGVIDPIEEIAALGVQYDIPVHVDACLGGFLIAFMEEAGYPLAPFDFRVEGITSISADTHKYGYAPKGTSVILYSDPKFRHHQFFVTPDWPGGIYATATIAGSRSGGIIASCWAAMVYHGLSGYVELTRKIVETARRISMECSKIPGIFVYGNPEVSVVSFGSEKFSIYTLADAMNKRGWNLNSLQYPASVHIAVTVLHTQTGIADKFISDIKEITADLVDNPPKVEGESAAMYGMAASIPDRSVIGEIAWVYLDAVYSTIGGKKLEPVVSNGIKNPEE
ncbi:sphingosine-1-phosphate lyase-like [Macrobrachium rosenbergii]|uniref:sphingosine-1-phosphate lyase-like n=1 Tax=Macrobrachium rosenbergii TaxID=79674 RepID=UPI0034D6555E